jgi:hypothetical protein
MSAAHEGNDIKVIWTYDIQPAPIVHPITGHEGPEEE